MTNYNIDTEKKINVGLTDLKKLTAVIKSVYNFDFSHYALSSFQRRVKRVLEINSFTTVDELILRIKKDVDFFNVFLEEITVNVTEMFRDPSFWRLIRDKILPEITTNSSLSIWHAGCSSGEEVFSMAIILLEYGIYDKVKIIATDINENVLHTAGSGIYPLKNMKLNQENYTGYNGAAKLSDYYSINGNKAVMDPALIKNVKFRKHDLSTTDEPFAKFDLILCRNVLLYFDKVLQDNVVKLFLGSLYNKSFLALGTKETLLWCSDAEKFKVESDREKIYKLRY